MTTTTTTKSSGASSTTTANNDDEHGQRRCDENNQILNMDKRTARKAFRSEFRNAIEDRRRQIMTQVPSSGDIVGVDDGTLLPSSMSLIDVYIRKRPLLPHEIHANKEFDVVTCYDTNIGNSSPNNDDEESSSGRKITMKSSVEVHDCSVHWNMKRRIDHVTYKNNVFAGCFDETATTDDVYEESTAMDLIRDSLLLSSSFTTTHNEGTTTDDNTAADSNNSNNNHSHNNNSVCIMMYGQTGSGKSYTMKGFYERIGRELFPVVLQDDDDKYSSSFDLVVSLSMFEIVGSKIYDLLPTSRDDAPSLKEASCFSNDDDDNDGGKENVIVVDDNNNGSSKSNNKQTTIGSTTKWTKKKVPLKLCEDEHGSCHALGIQEHDVSDYDTFLNLVKDGTERRATESTTANDVSSRSHSICRIRYNSKEGVHYGDGGGEILLLDLAGSEKNENTLYHTRERIQESIDINKSHFALKQCIVQAAKNRTSTKTLESSSSSSSFIPYRGSVLTRILKDSLFSTKHSKGIVIATVSPNSADTEHTLLTLDYASKMTMAMTTVNNDDATAASSVRREKQILTLSHQKDNDEKTASGEDLSNDSNGDAAKNNASLILLEKKIRLWDHNDVVQWWKTLSDPDVRDYSTGISTSVDGKQLLKWNRARFQRICDNESSQHGSYVYDELRNHIQKQNRYEKEQRELRRKNNKYVRD